MSRVILVSICNDKYVSLLLDMLGSLGSDILSRYDLGIIDLGLSESSKSAIGALKADVCYAESCWFLDLGDLSRTIMHKAFQSKPFIPELFPDYVGYIYIDSDIWFSDSSAIDDYALEGEKHGAIAVRESHPLMDSFFYDIKEHKFLGFTFLRTMRTMNFGRFRHAYGSDIAYCYGMDTFMNSGFIYIRGDSPLWQAWREAAIAAIKHRPKKMRFCDQTYLQYALLKNEISHAVFPIHYNWVTGADTPPLLDMNNKRLLDPIYPHNPVKVVHLTCKGKEFDVRTTDGDIIKTDLSYGSIKKLWS